MMGKENQFSIAIVDDELAVREATEGLLKSVGFRAMGFASAEDLLESQDCHQASCLILDVQLPGMSGLDLQRHLAGKGLHIPVVFITAQEDSKGQMQAQALQAGALAFLQKPFRDTELLGAIKSALRLRAKRTKFQPR
jgi:FixJ family two-component response regulator